MKARWAAAVAVILFAQVALMTTSAQALGSGGAAPAKAPHRGVVKIVPAYDHDLPIIPEGGLRIDSASASAVASSKNSSTVAVQPAYQYVCSVYAGDPYFEYGTRVHGWGYQSCSGSDWGPQNVQITIQTEAWLGYWNNRQQGQSGYTYVAFDENHQYFYCGGTGTYTYRVVIDAWVRGGQYKASGQSRNYYVVSC